MSALYTILISPVFIMKSSVSLLLQIPFFMAAYADRLSGGVNGYVLRSYADVPYLASNGIIDKPVNSFTGNPITMEGMHNMPMYVINSEDWNVNSSDTLAGADALHFCKSKWYRFDGTQVIDTEAWEFDGIR